MTREEIISSIAEDTGLPKAAVKDVVGLFVNVLGDLLVDAGKVQISGFGTLKTIKRAARAGRNPRTGDVIQTPEHNTVKFLPGKALKERVNE